MTTTRTGGIPPDQYPLQVFRVAAGVQTTVRILTRIDSRVLGCLTHYHQRRSYYCHKDCPSKLHTILPQWKGYLAADRWWPDNRLWYPCVLEVTESAELDMRGQVQRGTVWDLSRLDLGGRKRAPVRAACCEILDPNTWAAAYPLLPVVRALYGDMRVELTVPNPLPARTWVAPVRGVAPASDQQPAAAGEQATSDVGYLIERAAQAGLFKPKGAQPGPRDSTSE
jgi:hypothetical protein